LVPGGRFAITADIVSLRLWDLGPVGADGKEGPARLKSKGKSDCLVSQCQLLDGSRLNLVVAVPDLAVCIVNQHTLRVGVAIGLGGDEFSMV
jgi:hypothetical protein